MELKREKTVRALEEAIEYGCGVYREVEYDTLKDALALIRYLYEENERVTELCKLREQDNRDTCELLFKAEEELERLRGAK